MPLEYDSALYIGRAMPDAPSKKSDSVREMFSLIARRYDLANHLLSGGMDFLWRRRAARIVRGWGPNRIVDVATGSGDLALSLAHACPESTIVGVDFCQPMLLEARRKGVPHLVVGDALHLPFADGAFDALTVAFGLRNMSSWTGALKEMHRVIAPGGHVLVLEFSVPPPPLRWVYRPYLHYVLPRLASFVTSEQSAYEYLGDSIEDFPSGAAMCAMMHGAGFAQARCEPLSGGIVSLYTALRQ
jgi:demethylmenaquinone methyltransferase / 2-methoxy-6-polyprenyl-1,4-benzoquinol methylase